MSERFVNTDGTISLASGSTDVIGVGTSFGARDREAAQIYVHPAAGARFSVGSIAAVDPRGIYDDLFLPLVSPWNGAPIVNQPYEIVDGPAMASGALQAELYARFTAYLQRNMGLVGNIDDLVNGLPDPLTPNNSFFYDDESTTLYQWRNGVLQAVAANLQIDASGPSSGRSTYNNELPPFIYFSTDEAGFYFKNSAASGDWSALVSLKGASGLGDIFALSAFTGGRWDANEVVAEFEFVDAITFPAGLALSRVSAGVAATNASVWLLKKGGIQFGTVTFGAGSTVGVRSAATATAFAIGGVLSVVAPAVHDPTLSNIRWTFRAPR